ncbi:MAG TPA: glucose 1-dehydrogenase, partial [Candidatus Thermoplasmatota archaeon]|nr:glucose 1-dehydrogenase [Candidatus Thermoplasmatota archaeon]
VVGEGHGGFPPGEDALVLGHECLGEVLSAPEGSALRPGDRVVPLVRHGCGLCPLCASGKQDLCSTGRYREHGIKGLHGFLREEWTDDPAALVSVPSGLGDAAVLTEPLSVVLKALEVAEQVQRRLPWFEGWGGRNVLLAGTGSLGTLAAFRLAESGANVWGADRSGDDAAAARLLARLGVRHVDVRATPIPEAAREVGGFDLVLEATGAPSVVFDAVRALRENGALVVTGVPAQRPAVPVEADDFMRDLVMRNLAVVGSVNSNRRHFEAALQALRRWQDRWPEELATVITHRYRPEDAPHAVKESGPHVIKKVVDWTL